ncbi:hypothetical protein CAPTEDRAFT_201219 [Capitella teleta]|uniref:Calcineurin-like phosphoesterase domain-containing protein n=1 Tax=Capitella teleta TaxID=283909 RepID=R7VJW6_CAPTE|nr:hypothetical protein CAPTEDRAFT_201219 [Capitella teleta]|eukprot:ELU16841.1 hypothetical protein CAPTEDRAFT_201219 [Capitella teleta]
MEKLCLLCLCLSSVLGGEQKYFWVIADIHYDPRYGMDQGSCSRPLGHETSGFYTTLIPEAGPKIRCLALNSNIWSTKDTITEGDDPGHHFKWIQSVLEQARRNGEKVYILEHIIPGAMYMDALNLMMQPQFERRLIDVLSDFPDVIVAMFSAHQHYDTFQLIGKPDYQTRLLWIQHNQDCLQQPAGADDRVGTIRVQLLGVQQQHAEIVVAKQQPETRGGLNYIRKIYEKEMAALWPEKHYGER